MRRTAISPAPGDALCTHDRRAFPASLPCAAAVVMMLLGAGRARAVNPPTRPVVSFAGVGDPDEPSSTVAPDFEAKILAALRTDRNLQIYDPTTLDAQALPGPAGRLRLLYSEAPQLALTAYAHSLGDDVLIASVVRKEDGIKVRATLYGTAWGNTVLTWEGTDPAELVQRIDDAMGFKPEVATGAAVLLNHLAPVVASADLPLTLNATLRPSDGLTLAAWMRTTGGSNWSRVPFTLLRDDLYTANLPAVHDGSIEYYLVATDAQGKVVASQGSEEQPHFVQIIGVDNGTEAPAPPGNHAGAYASFALAAATLAVAIVFTVRTPTAAAERRSCWTTATCQAKSNYLLANETVMWTAWGATAAEVTLGGLAVHFDW